jgi:hypothetical protein
MTRNAETRVREFPILFQVDPSWYERYWLQQPAPRKPGILAFFRRILWQVWPCPRPRQTPSDGFASASERSCAADPARRPAVDLGKQGIEATQAAEAGAQCDLGDRELRAIEQPLRALHTGGLRDLDWARAEVLGEQAAELAAADAESPDESSSLAPCVYP